MPGILTAEDVVRRIAGECVFVDERGGGIRLETGGPQRLRRAQRAIEVSG
jgi:hypothetical protein